MEVVGFIGASGTGKSHHALVVAYDHEIQTIIDDGLLIDHNRIVAGRSAKDETNRLRPCAAPYSITRTMPLP